MQTNSTAINTVESKSVETKLTDSADLSHGVGRTLRAMRRERDLTQMQIGKVAGLSPSTVSEIERGNNNLSLDVLWRLCAAMSVKPYVMFEAATREEQRQAKRARRVS